MSDLIQVSEAVAAALATRQPVVALETTLVTHGLPDPEGVAAAVEMEEVVKEHGAVPATIGVIEGRIRVGLSREDIRSLPGEGCEKLNLSNLAAHVAAKKSGSTTVAATMAAAAHVGIRVFATGGIGGVHRKAGESGDVSSDLDALARFPVAVVCAGAKAILDLPLTVQRLETLGVPVYGFGTDEFPAFYRRSSRLPVDARFDDVRPLAAAIAAHWKLGFTTGVVVGNPVPADEEMPLELYEHALASALEKASRTGVRGRDVTPYLLEQLRVFSDGTTLFSNLALLRSNAALAADLASVLEQA